MATHANSTPAPARQRGLLPLAANHREIPGSCLTTQALADVVSPHDTLADIEADFAGLIAQPWLGQLSGNPGSLRDEALAASQSTAAQPSTINDLRPNGALASTAAGRLLPAAEARAIHMRRRLGEALEHGFALLDALDLPPLALDVIDGAIAALDAMEADDEDREDDDPAEGTSLETFGRGFVRAGADDEEDSDPAERDDDCGSEDEPYPWRYQHPKAVQIAAEACHG